MIVGTSFKGDDDDFIKLKQHDVYDRALTTIIHNVYKYTKAAKIIIDCDLIEPPDWPESFDHRTIQTGHDKLAAVWRNKTNLEKLKAHAATCEEPDFIETNWLNWLHVETMDWISEPQLIGAIYKILLNQNKKIGYQHEALLNYLLIKRFSFVPWVDSEIYAAKTDYETHYGTNLS